MTLSINSNIASLSAQRNLLQSNKALGTVFKRLSSGLRINSAKDDAAGLSISTRMEAKIREHNQGIRNANDGISLAQVAESGMQEAINVLQRMRELAVQSANGTYTSSDRIDMESELDQLKAQMNSIASDTEFNGQTLLDGTFTGKKIAVGGHESVDLDLINMNTSHLPEQTSSFDINNSSFVVNATTSGSQVASAVTPLDNGNFAITWSSDEDIYAQIVDADGVKVGTEFIVNENITSDGWGLPSITSLNDGDFVITWNINDGGAAHVYGQQYDIDGNRVNNEFKINETNTTLGVGISSVQKLSDGGFSVVFQSYDGVGDAAYSQKYDSDGNPVGGNIKLADVELSFDGIDNDLLSDGNNVIVYLGRDSQIKASIFDVDFNAVQPEFTVNTTATSGWGLPSVTALDNGNFVVTWFDSSQTQTKGQLVENSGQKIGDEFTIADYFNAKPAVVALDDGGFAVVSGEEGDDGLGDLFIQNFNSDGTKDGSISYISQQLNYDNSLLLYGPTSDSIARTNNGDFLMVWDADDGQYDVHATIFQESSVSSRSSVSKMSVLTQSLAQISLSTIDSSIDTVSAAQAEIGAFQNRLESISNNLMNQAENTSQARSRIMDADIAQETANLTTASIIQQAGVAILAQANQQPQIALQLLG